MKKEHRVKSQIDFQKVIKQGYKFANKHFVLYVLKKEHETYRFGISVGKKLGNAVFRNKNKRQMREIISAFKDEYIAGFDYVVIIKKQGVELNFQERKKSLYKLFNGANILKREG